MRNNKEPEGGAEVQETAVQSEQPLEQSIELLSQIEAAKKQLIEADDKYLRLYAEFDNYRRRTDQEKGEFARYASRNVLEALIPILDSFNHSQSSFDNLASTKEDLQKGFALIHKQFEDALLKFGVKKIEAKGQLFDPNFHEAVMQKDSDQPSQTVLEELQVGFMIHDKVLRPSMVVVAK